MVQKAECPQCGEEITVGTQPRIGQQVVCNYCGSTLEVVWLDPLELDWPMMEYEEDEDFEEYDEDEEE